MIFTQTNDAETNAVVAYGGGLEPLGRFPTGGRGTGEPHLPSQGSLVVADDRLLVANAGSGDVSVFAVDGDDLELVRIVRSGGARPVSVAARGDDAFVLNGGGRPSVGRISLRDWTLVSTRPLAAGSDPAQIAFTPAGDALVVTERGADAIAILPVDEGEAVTHASAGATPYGFDFAGGTLVVTEAFGGAAGAAAASSYRVEGGALTTVSPSVGDTRSEVCWAVASPDGRTVWVTNFGDGTISRYAVAADGTLTLADPVAATTVLGSKGIRDAARSRDGRFLYALDADARRVFGWTVAQDGVLAPIGSVDGLPATAAGLAAL